jgi:transcription elongation factor Elf1
MIENMARGKVNPERVEYLLNKLKAIISQWPIEEIKNSSLETRKKDFLVEHVFNTLDEVAYLLDSILLKNKNLEETLTDLVQLAIVRREDNDTPLDNAIGLAKVWTCPRCKKKTTNYPAISRRDNISGICSDCGTAEAMIDVSIHSTIDKKMQIAALVIDAMWLPTETYQKFLDKLPELKE